jgi:DNA-directed RNA polymerase I, II, and III subunit RPABC1
MLKEQNKESNKTIFKMTSVPNANNPRKVILNMLKIRKYLIEDPEDFINSESEEFLTHKIDDEDSKIYVFFPKISNKVGVFTIRQYVREMQENSVDQAIVVVKDSITAFAKQVFIEAKPLVIECFKEKELLVDILEHDIVPKHELLEEEEKKELLKIYKAKEGQLPKMLSSDPVARYFGAKKGQVFKITRVSESSGNYIYYRIVV